MVNPVPVQAVATSRPDNDAGLFHLSFDDDALPAVRGRRRDLDLADRAAAGRQRRSICRSITDVVMSLSYTARTGGAALEAVARADREKGLARGGIKPEALHYLSLRRDLPAVWKRLEEAAARPGGRAGAPARRRSLFRPLSRARSADRARHRVRAARAARWRPTRCRCASIRQRDRARRSPAWVPPWPRSRTLRATAEVSGPAGAWKLAVKTTEGKPTELLDDLVLIFELRVKKA